MIIDDIRNKKKTGRKISMLTAYDYATASLVDQAGIDMVLVGDSLSNVVLGRTSTRDVTMEEMIHHTKAVRRGVVHAMLVGDMPYCAYQENPSKALPNARRFVDEAGCDAVKIECFDGFENVVRDLVKDGISVMGHVGLTPQTADRTGGFKVRGKDEASAQEILHQALAFEKAGCFAVVLECIPVSLAQKITQELAVPTIGIGAGVSCDGQVLVIHDLLGLSFGHRPKFVKPYADLQNVMRKAIEAYKFDVDNGRFPDDEHSYH